MCHHVVELTATEEPSNRDVLHEIFDGIIVPAEDPSIFQRGIGVADALRCGPDLRQYRGAEFIWPVVFVAKVFERHVLSRN
jgi:hypothetical protein